MYLRTTSRRNKDGSVVRYLQLAHNVWDPERGQAHAQVLYSFGREDQLDREALARLTRSLGRFLETDATPGGDATWSFLGSRPINARFIVESLWPRLEPGPAPVVQALVDLVAEAAGGSADPEPEPGAAAWEKSRWDAICALVTGDGALGQAMSMPPARRSDWAGGTATVAGPLAFEPWPRAAGPRRPRARVALALAGAGVPVGLWRLPAEARRVVGELHDHLGASGFERVVWTGWDDAVRAEVSRRHGDVLIEAGGRSGTADHTDRQDDRRAQLIQWIELELEAVRGLSGDARRQAEGALRSNALLGPYLVVRSGRLTIDRARLRAEHRPAGRPVLTCSDRSLSAGELASLHRAAREVRRAWESLRLTVPGYPAYLSDADRLQAGITIGFLALRVVRMAELAWGTTWGDGLRQLAGLHVGVFEAGRQCFVRWAKATPEQTRLITSLGLDAAPQRSAPRSPLRKQ